MKPRRKPTPTAPLTGGFALAQFQAEQDLAAKVGFRMFEGVTTEFQRREQIRQAIAGHAQRRLYEPDFERLYGEPVGTLL